MDKEEKPRMKHYGKHRAERKKKTVEKEHVRLMVNLISLGSLYVNVLYPDHT